MTTQPIALFLLFVALLTGSFADTAFEKNRLSGKITMPDAGASVKKGNNLKYCEEDPPTAKRLKLDEENQPNRQVIVSLHPLDFTAELSPTENAMLNQQEKTFVPRVLPITKGSKIYIMNNDVEVHNVFSRTPKAIFNIGRRKPGNSVGQLIERAGAVDIRCDIHCGMRAVVLSLETPYFAKVDAAGNYTIDGLPDGRYRLEVYHLDLGNYEETVTLKNGGISYKNVNLSRP